MRTIWAPVRRIVIKYAPVPIATYPSDDIFPSDAIYPY